MATIGFDVDKYERKAPTNSLLPVGTYTGTIVRIQQKNSKKGGVYEEVEFDLSTPGYENRKFWDRFNIINASPKAQEIAREALADLAKAAGIRGVLNDDQELLGKSVQLEIIIKQPTKPKEEPTDPKYLEPQNECKKYHPIGYNPKDHKAAHNAAAAKPSWGAQPVAAAESPVKAAPWGKK